MKLPENYRKLLIKVQLQNTTTFVSGSYCHDLWFVRSAAHDKEGNLYMNHVPIKKTDVLSWKYIEE